MFFLYSLCRQHLVMVVECFMLCCQGFLKCYILVVVLYCSEFSELGTKRNLQNNKKKIWIHFSTFYSEKKYWSHSCLIVAIFSGPADPTLVQVHSHCHRHGYIVLKQESCSYSSEFCYASFQVIPQY